ncbi:UDP-N-acetylmuramyl-tripeptide synthetase [Candidatus Falkowbacteria bacterium]|nr:UDP-N-acetylmuramyl-tripeptide synthetase [Candidatus Falkowbacteria bacterium]
MNITKIKRIIPKKVWSLLGPLYHFSWGLFANLLYHAPSNKLIVIGVTGTTGKTTSVYLIAKMLNAAGYKTGFTSTAMFNDGEKEWLNNKKMTMVGRLFTYQILAKMVKNGCRFAVVETSSEGIIQYRHRFINYDLIICTGLYPEHIESHGSFEKYREAKGMLFAHLKDCRTKYANQHFGVQRVEAGLKKLALNRVRKTVIVNGDDEHKDYFLSFWAETKWQYRLVPNAVDVKLNPNEDKDHNFHEAVATNISVAADGTSFTICQGGVCTNERFHLHLIGAFNVNNAMTAVSVGLALGLPLATIKQGLESVSGVPGRLEMLETKLNFGVIVDYAFEPHAVSRLYETLLLLPHNRIIHILGSAGGGRDVSRRPILGHLAGEQADVVIVTNEDPYDDDPTIIIDQVALGAEKAGKILGENLFKIHDRREAIARALVLADFGDIVLITGKGNEQAICVANGKKIPWDDRVVAREEIDKLKQQNSH